MNNFGRLWVKEPRQSESISDEKCYLHRSSRLERLHDFLLSRHMLLILIWQRCTIFFWGSPHLRSSEPRPHTDYEYQIFQETVSQGKTSNGQGRQIDRFTLKTGSFPSVKAIIGKLPSVKGLKWRLLTSSLTSTIVN